MDHTTALAELLSQHGFHRHALVRNQVGHFQLVGLLHDAPVDILLDTGKLGGGAGGITLAIHALDGATLSLDGHPLRSDGIYAVDLTHVNEGLVTKGASRVQGVLGADVLTYHQRSSIMRRCPCSYIIQTPNQSMKPTAPFRCNFSLFATTLCRGLSLFR